MIALILAAVMAASAPAGAGSNVARAQVSVRIISGARVSLGRSSDDGSARLRRTTIRLEGRETPAQIIELP